jgi:hypothetical protein
VDSRLLIDLSYVLRRPLVACPTTLALPTVVFKVEKQDIGTSSSADTFLSLFFNNLIGNDYTYRRV